MKTTNRRQFDSPKPIILAHRGGSKENKENTLKAFEHAVSLGYAYLETDVHLGVDNKLYLHHGRPTLLPNKLLPADNSYTSLETLFQTFPDCCFSIDPKHEPAAKPLAELIIKYKMAERVCLVSPSDDQRAARIADSIKDRIGIRPITALSSLGSTLELIASPRRLAARKDAAGAASIDVHYKIITPKLIKRAHQHNLKIVAWTVNNPAVMQKLLNWGVDGFMTDVPTIAQKFLI